MENSIFTLFDSEGQLGSSCACSSDVRKRGGSVWQNEVRSRILLRSGLGGELDIPG
jgi:hypothetical protein